MAGSSPGEPTLRLICGGILWALSSLLTAALFLAFAKELPQQIVLFCLAASLEGAKILSWRMGGAFRLLSVSLIALSITASFGAALSTVQEFRRLPSPSQEVRRMADSRQREILLERLRQLPIDYTTAARELNAELGRLRSLETSSTGVPGLSGTSVFDLMAEVLRIPVDLLMVVLLLAIAINLEVSALVLAGHSRSSIPADFHDLFLRAAKEGAPLPVLHGRDATARKLGISYYQAKLIVRDLAEAGTIKVVGKRLVLCDPRTIS